MNLLRSPRAARALAAALCIAIAGPGCMHAAAVAQDPLPPVVVPMTIELGRPFVEVMVNGRGPYRFLVDTGAEGVGRIDTRIARELGLEPVGQSGNSDGFTTRQVDLIRVDRLEVGGVAVENAELLSRDYNPPTRSRDLLPLDGVIGSGFFDDSLTTFDFPGRRLIFDRSGSLLASDDHVVPLGEAFDIPLEIGGVERRCSLDTGSTVTLHVPIALAADLVEGDLEGAGAAERANTRVTMRRGVLKAPVRLAGNQVDDLAVVFSDRAEEINLGSGLLSRFVVTVDQRSRLVRIAPPPAANNAE